MCALLGDGGVVLDLVGGGEMPEGQRRTPVGGGCCSRHNFGCVVCQRVVAGWVGMRGLT